MPKTTKIMVAALLLFALGNTAAFASSNWEGSADGSCGGINPFVPWEGTLDETTGPHAFMGFWGNDQFKYVYGDVDSTVSGVKWLSGDWYYNNTDRGDWVGYFDESGDDAAGDWWATADSSSCNGAWWGNLAD